MADSSVDALKKLYKQSKAAKERLEADWYLNIAYYYGHQWVFWNRGRVDQVKFDEDWRVQLVDNRILPVVDSRLARKTKNKPVFVATPFSADEQDIKAASMSEKVLENDWLKMNLQLKHYRAQKWEELTGAGFWKVYWDKTKGKSAEYYFMGDEPYMVEKRPARVSEYPDLPNMVSEAASTQQQGTSGSPAIPTAVPSLEPRNIAQGDVCIEVISPFEIFPDPLAQDIDECEWIIEEKVRSVEYVRKRFDQDLKPDADVPTGLVESRMFMPGLADASAAKGVTVFEYWAKPSSKNKKGKWCVFTNDKVLFEKTLDEAPFEYCPYVMFTGPRVPGRFWPTCITTQLRGPQTELNKLKSQIRENAMRIGNPSLLRNKAAAVEFFGVPGEDVLYDGTLPDSRPQYLQPPEMPAYVQNEVAKIEDSITEISGVHEVSKASVPAGVTAASAINLLQEADDTRLGPEVYEMEDTLSRGGTKVLRLRAKYTTDEQMIQIAGEDGDWELDSYRREMLADNTNVEVQAGSAMPRSKAAKQAAMTEILSLMMQYGIEIDNHSLRKFLKDYEVGGLDRLFENISSDEQQVTREHRKMFNGEAIDINDWDDDDYHIDSHENEQKSARYENADPEVQKLIAVHKKAHVERRQDRINMELQQSGQLVPQQQPAQNGGQQGASEYAT